ncbi:MAG: two-component system response regulator [Thermoplasmatota archaeon]
MKRSDGAEPVSRRAALQEPARPGRARPGATRERSGTVRTRARARRPKVLIADPNPDVLESTAILIANLGYEPVPVDQPTDLLELVEAARPGLVLLETQFPGLNVAGFLAALRAHPPTAGIPVALFSASKELAATAARHQVWASLAKPFALRELAQLLQAALGPSPAMQAKSGNVEREVRESFREFRNLVTALDNYLALLATASELSRPSRLAVQRLEDVALKIEAKAEHLRAYVLSLMVPPTED